MKLRIHHGCGGKVVSHHHFVQLFYCTACRKSTDYVTFVNTREEILTMLVVPLVFQPRAIQN